MTTNPPHHIDFYFDPISPYAWLAANRLDSIRASTGMAIIAHPILFAGLLKAHGNLGPAEIPAKREYIFRDVMRRAAYLKLNAECPPNHPFNPLLALRVCTAVSNNEQRLRLAGMLMNAAWRDGLDITLPDNVHSVLTQCGLDADQLLAMTQDKGVKQRLISATQDAVERGIFGVPTFYLDGQIFWGEDRIDDLIHCVNSQHNGQHIDVDKLTEVLTRAAAVQRKR